MCGIFGVFGRDYEKAGLALQKMKHRGPDYQGESYFDDIRLALSHARLSILDVSGRSNQPMTSSCGNYIVVYNGEIYNHQELRSQLKSKKYKFNTESDTETLLYWLIAFGQDGITNLDGMFSFCFYDKNKDSLLIARDHIGEKPLYYSHEGENFAFSSEISPLLELSWIDKRLNKNAFKNYLYFLYAPPPDTFYNGIKELAPGCYIKCDLKSKKIEIKKYFDLVDSIPIENKLLTESEEIAILRDGLYRSVKSRLMADVPVGVYLSGGLDSNSIASIASSAMPGKIDSFTIGYSSSQYSEDLDESRIAKKCADFYGIKNKSFDYKTDVDFISELNNSINQFGQPFGNGTTMVASMLAENVSKSHKVCLVGDAGDELLSGYPRHKAVRFFRTFNYTPGIIKKILICLARMIPESGRYATKARRIRQFLFSSHLPIENAYLSWVGYSDFEGINDAICSSGTTSFYENLLNVFRKYHPDPARAAGIVDFISFVPFNLLQCADRTSMHSSIELRAPFVAKDFVLEMLGMSSKNKISRKYNKPLLIKAMNSEVPMDIISKPKRPFNPPMRELIDKNINLIEKLLMDKHESKICQILKVDFMKKVLGSHQLGKEDRSTYIWALCLVEIWLRKNYENTVLVAG